MSFAAPELKGVFPSYQPSRASWCRGPACFAYERVGRMAGAARDCVWDLIAPAAPSRLLPAIFHATSFEAHGDESPPYAGTDPLSLLTFKMRGVLVGWLSDMSARLPAPAPRGLCSEGLCSGVNRMMT